MHCHYEMLNTYTLQINFPEILEDIYTNGHKRIKGQIAIYALLLAACATTKSKEKTNFQLNAVG